MTVWVAFTVIALCQASPEETPGHIRYLPHASNQARTPANPLAMEDLSGDSHSIPENTQKPLFTVQGQTNKGEISEGASSLKPDMSGSTTESERISHFCDDTSHALARKLCSTNQRDDNMQPFHQVSSPEEARTLHQLGQSTSYSSYINHGNAVHINGQFLQPQTHGEKRQNLSHIKLAPNAYTDSTQQPVQLPHSDQVPYINPSIRPISHTNREKYTTRINSKVLTSEDLEYLRSLRVQSAEEHNNQYPQHQTLINHKSSQKVENMQLDSQFKPKMQPLESSNYNSREHSNLQPSLIAQFQTISAPKKEIQSESSPVTSDEHSLSNTNNHHQTWVPLTNTVNVQISDSSNLQKKEKTADIADILTNLQILTILMNQDGIYQPHTQGHSQDTLITSVNGGSSFVNLDPQVSQETSKAQQILTPKEESWLEQTEELTSKTPSGAPPTDIHKAAIYQIQARNKQAAPKNDFTYASQFPFAIHTTDEDSPTPSNTVETPESEWHGPSYLLPEGPKLFPSSTASPIPSYQPDFPLYPFVKVDGDSQSTQTETPVTVDDGRIIYQDTGSTVVSYQDNINHDTLVNHHTPQLSSHHDDQPYTRPSQENPQSLEEIISQITALSEHLENLKKKFAAQNHPSTSTPALLYDPALNSQDLILASLLNSQIHTQPSHIRPPASSLSPNSPYIPAYHNINDAYDDYYAPAPPDSVSVFPAAKPEQKPQQDEASITPISSGGSFLSNIGISAVVASLATGAIAIPFMFGRRKRDTNDYHRILQNITESVENHPSLLMERYGVTNTEDGKHFNKLLMNPHATGSNEILKNITKYIKHNKKELLKNVVKEVEDLTSKPITNRFLAKVSSDDTEKLLQFLKNMLAIQTISKLARPREKLLSRATRIHQHLNQNHAMNPPDSMALNGYTKQHDLPIVNERQLFPPPLYTFRANQKSGNIISNPQSLKSPNQFLQNPNFKKSNNGYTIHEASPNNDPPAINKHIFSLYNSVCRALTELDAVPHSDVINFIAQRCLLLAYAGLLQ